MIRAFVGCAPGETSAVEAATKEANQYLEELALTAYHVTMMHTTTVFAPTPDSTYDGYYVHTITLFVQVV